ncbi:MAG: PHP domain-containing protein [Candidatus Actinomarina sp.]
MSIDLHIHSKNSDGTDTIDEIVSKSKDQQIQAISITDHEYLSEVKDNEGIEIISGVEMSVSWNDLDLQNPYSGIHLLIYF